VAWFAGMIDQVAWMRKPHEGFRSEHLEHVTKKLALAAAKRTVGRPLADHLERHPIGGPTAPICGASGHVVDGHQPQAGLANQLVHDQGQRPTLQPAGTTAGVVGSTMVLMGRLCVLRQLSSAVGWECHTGRRRCTPLAETEPHAEELAPAQHAGCHPCWVAAPRPLPRPNSMKVPQRAESGRNSGSQLTRR
jgi:hypothetical protein